MNDLTCAGKVRLYRQSRLVVRSDEDRCLFRYSIYECHVTMMTKRYRLYELNDPIVDWFHVYVQVHLHKEHTHSLAAYMCTVCFDIKVETYCMH